jgi:hypothetical protein
VVSVTLLLLYPGERAPGTHWAGSWVGPRAGLDAVEKRTRAVQPVACHYTDSLKRVGDIGHLSLTSRFAISDFEFSDRPVSMQTVIFSCIPSTVLVKCSKYPLFVILFHSLLLST